jgi:tRNA (adenine57-N1/adenine58-N1)-methyltransferase
MAVIVYKPERRVIVDGVSRVICKHEQWYVSDTGRDFHCAGAIIRKDQLTPGVHTVGNHEFVIIPSTYLDDYKTIRRDAQIITRKDLGFLIGFCGLTKKSVILESGAGSGAATILLANLCKKIYSVEIDKENIAVVEENLKKLNVTNAAVRLGDIYDVKSVKGIKDVDFVLLDVPEPGKALASARKAMRLGAYVAAYTPSITQAQKLVNNLPREFLYERTTEIIDRDWRIKGDAVRPVTADIGHTAFLTILRRIL